MWDHTLHQFGRMAHIFKSGSIVSLNPLVMVQTKMNYICTKGYNDDSRNSYLSDTVCTMFWDFYFANVLWFCSLCL